MESTNV